MLQIIAYITMFIDHIGICFFPEVEWLRWIGRLAAPIFAYGIASGYQYAKEHQSLIRYLTRLTIFAMVSQIPFLLMLGPDAGWNVGMTWVLSLMGIAVIDTLPGYGWFVAVILACGAELIRTDGGFIWVMLTLLTYQVLVKKGPRWYGYLICAALHLAHPFLWTPPLYIQAGAAAAYPVIALVKRYGPDWRLPRKVAYLLYPAHMLLFAGIKAILF